MSQAPPPDRRPTLGVVSLGLGAVAVPTLFCFALGIPLGLAALVTGAVALVRDRGRPPGAAGPLGRPEGVAGGSPGWAGGVGGSPGVLSGARGAVGGSRGRVEGERARAVAGIALGLLALAAGALLVLRPDS